MYKPLLWTLLLIMTGAAGAAELTGTLKKIHDTGTIALGVRDASIPFSYLDDKQQPVGYSVDLCMKVVDALKNELKLPNLKVEKQVVTSQTRIPLIANGTVDLECGSTVNNIERQKQVAFSVTTFVVYTKFIVKKTSGIRAVADMKGKSVAVTAGTNTVQKITALNTQGSLGLTLLQGKDHAESFLLMDSGRAVAFAEDDILLAGLAANAKAPDAYQLVAIEGMAADPYALMMRRDDAPFKALVDGALKQTFKSGEIARMYDQWFTKAIPPRGVVLNFPMSDQLKRAIALPNDSGDPKDYN
jgi:glutamate/aspartate transport system substrate-binding protein